MRNVRKIAVILTATLACVPQSVAHMSLPLWSSLGVTQWSLGSARGHYSSWWCGAVWRARGRPCEWWTWCPPLDGSAGRRAGRPSGCSSGILCKPESEDAQQVNVGGGLNRSCFWTCFSQTGKTNLRKKKTQTWTCVTSIWSRSKKIGIN